MDFVFVSSQRFVEFEWKHLKDTSLVFLYKRARQRDCSRRSSKQIRFLEFSSFWRRVEYEKLQCGRVSQLLVSGLQIASDKRIEGLLAQFWRIVGATSKRVVGKLLTRGSEGWRDVKLWFQRRTETFLMTYLESCRRGCLWLCFAHLMFQLRTEPFVGTYFTWKVGGEDVYQELSCGMGDQRSTCTMSLQACLALWRSMINSHVITMLSK